MPEWVGAALADGARRGRFLRAGSSRWHGEALPLQRAGRLDGALVVWHEAGYIDAQGAQLWRQNFARLFLHVVLISLTTLVVLQWWLLRPMSKTVEWLRRLRSGELLDSEPSPRGSVFAPLAREITQLARSLTAARAAAEEEARLRHAGESRWTAERLKEQVRTVLQGRPLLVVANREPYLHVRQGRQIRWLMPASGLVTAVEPILRACGGTWVAHGSGDADRETADAEGRLRVPPDEPQYTLRRVWLTKEEEDGYYYRFANEGLWPLCHIAHTRPVFHADDWAQYRRVNEKFSEAVLDELKGTERPCVLIQDYHFALLPRLLKQRRPDAQIALFWHIPWPNPEAFGICPWARELLHGMLGADLLGFHIQFHCNNFLDTVDRTLESRIDWESFAVNRAGHTTRVKPFPISIAWTPPDETCPPTETLRRKEALLQSLGLQAQWLGVGVDRIDYTKGIGERFRAVERLLERYPQYQGAFTFVELGAPSRTLIPRYHDLGAELEAEADRINRRFQTRTWKPILFLKKHHSHAEIAPFYQAADICLVTSLHDGMNLVAKEFVAARDDRRGVLLLSRFAGASRELRDALVVNPYDLDRVAEALHDGLTMAPADQEARMRRMQETLQAHNVYRWAAELVGELAQIRPPSA
ncbi:MAG: hypothetical protein A3C53_06420 [Omnitrophica WOR_2 bacterium RIFCSPHIGHO2_02_FULL_68_15]|nr:MAG: hypothetical protein A3C53_06420 [Omnitrophica WOR_2 bacterium RIFCSPHIGHO2_02_FULL_68_15]